MNLLADILYTVSAVLLIPVEALLVVLLGWTLYTLGGFLGEWLAFRRSAGRPGTVEGQAEGLACQLAVTRALPRRVRNLLRPLETPATLHPLVAEHCLDEAEAEMTRIVEISSLISKIGPMLGLAGTLIPLGPALAAMAAGDMSVLAQQLTIAFTATVVGLVIAGSCFWISLTRRRWYAKVFRDLEYYYRAQMAPSEESNHAATDPHATP